MAELEKFIETDADDGTVKLNGKNTFKKNQYVTEGNYAVDLANSDIWKANGIWFADTSNAINKGFMFPRSDGNWDSLSVLDGKIKLTTGITAGLGITNSGGTTQVIADYVVDTGTSDIWTYRKWNSGIAECWASDITSSSAGSAEGNVYWSRSNTYNFPSGLFISAPTVNISVGCGSSYLTWASINSLTKDLVAWYYVHDTNNAKNAIFNNIEAKGRWK